MLCTFSCILCMTMSSLPSLPVVKVQHFCLQRSFYRGLQNPSSRTLLPIIRGGIPEHSIQNSKCTQVTPSPSPLTLLYASPQSLMMFSHIYLLIGKPPPSYESWESVLFTVVSPDPGRMPGELLLLDKYLSNE